MFPLVRIPLSATTLILAACGGATDESTTSAAPAPAEAPGSAAGAQAYATNCVTCHGPTGAGNGPMVSALTVKPRSFAVDEWRFVDFTAGDAAVRVTLERVLRDGVPDAMMPGYASTLSDAQIDALVDHVLTLRRQGR